MTLTTSVTPTGMAAKRAVAYTRVSTTGQAGERHSSLETQLDRFKRLCESKGYSPVGTFTDTASGRRDDRREYQRMVDFALGGGADVIVVQFLDRFGRNPREILRRYWELQERGVTIEATDEDLREELVLLVRAGVAGAESKRNSERVRANMARAISKGVHTGRAPFGLRAVRTIKDGKPAVAWEIDQTEAAIVREMARLITEEGLGYKATADRLNTAGHRTRAGRPFATYTVSVIINNPALMGSLIYGRKPRKGNAKAERVEVADVFPPILLRDEWAMLGKRLAIRREKPKSKTTTGRYLLAGVVFCGHCGGPMTGKTGRTYKGRTYANYYCSHAQRSRALCGFYNGHSKDKLENAVLEYLCQFADADKVRQMVTATSGRETARTQRELEAVEKRLSELDAAFLADLDRMDRGVFTETEFARINNARRTERAGLEAKHTALADAARRDQNASALAESVPVAIRGFLDAVAGMDTRVARAQLQGIVKALRIFTDGRIAVEFRA